MDDQALFLIDPRALRGLEIGPLHRPKVSKRGDSVDVFYVDHCETEELRRRYAANAEMRGHLDEIVDVDYVIQEGATLLATVGPDAPFDYVIGSHLIEHIANPIGFLKDAGSVLAPRGIVSLVVPDKRFTFDVNRELTLPREWIEWYLRDLRVPSYGQLFDFFSRVTCIEGSVDTPGIWAGTADYSGVVRDDVDDAEVSAFQVCLQQQAVGQYIDVHAGVYTPESFLDLLELAAKLELINFEIMRLLSTPRNALEFYVTLQKMENPSVEHAMASIQRARDQLVGADRPGSPGGHSSLVLSDKEVALVRAKRSLMQRLRLLPDHLRRALALPQGLRASARTELRRKRLASIDSDDDGRQQAGGA